MSGLGTAEFLTLPLLILFLVLVVLYLLTLQRALERCSAEVRALSPQLVWLMFIPLVNVVWNFVLVVALSRSLGREFRRRGIKSTPHPGRTLGLAMCILVTLSYIPPAALIAGAGALACWIAYWAKIAACSRQLAANPALRLANPGHPARKQLEQVVTIVDRSVQIELAGDRGLMKASASDEDRAKAIPLLDEAIAACPDDMDLLVAKACVQYALAQFKSAEETLDTVLGKTPDHFEARMWNSHLDTWSNALRFPAWDERSRSLHPVMAAHLKLGHTVQVVRDGIQKTLAIVANAQGPALGRRARVDMEWMLSNTPFGPLVAYYLRIREGSGEPDIIEAFLPVFQPTLFSPMESFFLVQQLAFTPYCFVVLVRGETPLLNRRIVFGEKTVQRLRDIAAQLSSAQSYLAQQDFQRAAQWHMSNVDMKRLDFAQ